MAKANILYKKIVKPIESVTLTLNQEEFQTLYAVLNRIGGDPVDSPRKHVNKILNALWKAYEGDTNFPERKLFDDHDGQSMSFMNYKEAK
jgi:hypothetical protein